MMCWKSEDYLEPREVGIRQEVIMDLRSREEWILKRVARNDRESPNTLKQMVVCIFEIEENVVSAVQYGFDYHR